jgi:hypothetical protein
VEATDEGQWVEPVVTRVEVIDHVGEAFSHGPQSRAHLLEAARRTDARPAVLALLGRLPERRFTRPHDLWLEIGEVPVDR